MRTSTSRRIGTGSLALALVLTVAGLGNLHAAGPDPSVVGSWSAPMPLGVIGIHAAVLPDGEVLYFELPGSTLARARRFDPSTGATTAVDPNLPWSVFCAGMSYLPDGRLLITGGEPPRTAANPVGTGTASAVIFDPATNTWTPTARMAYPRWYPSNVAMPDGTTLVFGGEKAPTGSDKIIKQTEAYDPASDTFSTLPASANLGNLYPRVLLLPDGHLLAAGPAKLTKEFDPATRTWRNVSSMRFGARQAGGVVLLPDLHTVLTAGGQQPGKPATATAELLNMAAATPAWTPTGSMGIARMHENLVLLPDGSVLAVGGGQTGKFGSPVKTAERYDPATGTWSTMATQAGQRTYHSTAVLLPDGRVASAGSNSGTPEQTTVEIYSPPYLFRGARPTIGSAPASIGYGGSFDVATAAAASIRKVALIRLPATTHGWAQDQRYVALSFTTGAGVLHVSGPKDAATAPPGPYMLFIVDADDVPSVAPILSVG